MKKLLRFDESTRMKVIAEGHNCESELLKIKKEFHVNENTTIYKDTDSEYQFYSDEHGEFKYMIVDSSEGHIIISAYHDNEQYEQCLFVIKKSVIKDEKMARDTYNGLILKESFLDGKVIKTFTKNSIVTYMDEGSGIYESLYLI